MTNLDITTLEAPVEALIQQQVAAYEAQLREALGRKLSGGQSKKRKTSESGSSRRSRATGPRRTPEQVDALATRLLAAVESTPGETMTTLAARVGVGPAELSLPASRLKKTGRVKTVGERSRTRYYAVTP
ncbi:MAG: hypothetical protein GXP55_13485, partial [Deltaproteobacteria bacterium]|nr:hypothetical protein [Deltaproteobacteria bacterium]